MTTFRAFLKILRKNIVTIIISTVVLVVFGSFSMSADNGMSGFVADKPDITIINRDTQAGVTAGLIEYLSNRANIIDLPDDEEKLKDALFYRGTNLIVYIPAGYNEDFLAGKNPAVDYQSSGDYQAAFAEMMLSRYLRTAEIYRTQVKSGDELVKKVAEALDAQAEVEITSKLDVAGMSKAARFFNFESYALLNSLIFIIAMVMASFNEPKVRQRLLVSSTSPSHQNRILFVANILFAVVLWAIYLGLGFVLLGGDKLWSWQGLCFVLNSAMFMIAATALAFLVGSLVRNKNAINGSVNVVALGSSFLCGAFVPQAWLPEAVRGLAHVLPTYYYIETNDLIAQTDVLDTVTLNHLIFNMGVVLAFAVGFVVLTNILARLRKK